MARFMPFVAVEALLFSTDPASYLPHRHPFLFLDRVLELEKGQRAVACLHVSALSGYSPILMVEAVAQLAGIVTVDAEGEGGFLAAIERAEFHGQASEGDLLTIRAEVIKNFGRLFMVTGQVLCGEKQLLSVNLTLGVGTL